MKFKSIGQIPKSMRRLATRLPNTYTAGKTYEIITTRDSYYIINDKGSSLSFSTSILLGIAAGKSKIWEPVESPQPIEEKPMNKQDILIEHVTLIDGDRADEYPNASLIRLIKQEEQEISLLMDIQVRSIAIAERIIEHKVAIDEIVKILDARVKMST